MRSDLYGGQDGVSVPEDNTQTLYPWFVHFCSHITASGALKAADSTGDNSAIEVHVVSAEIVHISAIFFPIILYALGIKIPNHIIYHKSYSGIQSGMRGEIKSSTEPYEALIDHGADAVRFAAMSAAHDNHYAFSSLTAVKKVKKRYLSSLIGNYILRITSKRVNPGSFYPNSYVSERSFPVVKLVEDCNHFVPKITEAANVCDLKEYCILVLDFLHSMNVGINKSEIWKLSPVMELSEMSDLYKDALYAAFEHLRIACIISQPVLPETMKKFLDFLKIPEEERTLENAAVGKKYIRSTPDPIPEKTILDIGALDAIIIKTDD